MARAAVLVVRRLVEHFERNSSVPLIVSAEDDEESKPIRVDALDGRADRLPIERLDASDGADASRLGNDKLGVISGGVCS